MAVTLGWNHLLTPPSIPTLWTPPRPPWPWAKAWGFSWAAAHSMPTCALDLEASKTRRRGEKGDIFAALTMKPILWDASSLERNPSARLSTRHQHSPPCVTAVTKEDKVSQVALTFPCSEGPLGLVQEQPEHGAQSPLSQQRSDPPKGPLHLTHQEDSSNTAPFGKWQEARRCPAVLRLAGRVLLSPSFWFLFLPVFGLKKN